MDTIYSTYLEAEKTPLDCEKACLYDAQTQEYHFCHHPALGVFGGRLYAMWSNGKEGEDEIGQRVLYAVSEDGLHFCAPRVLCEAFAGERTLNTLTAAGFYTSSDALVAYVAAYEYASLEEIKDKQGNARLGKDCVRTALYALVSTDGEHFSAPRNMNVPLCPNYSPQRLHSGRLLITGNWAHAYTDEADGLSGWHLRGFCEDEEKLEKPVRDDPSYFWRVSKAMGLPGGVCEGAYIEEDDGALHMLHRSYASILYQSDSTDGGEHWSLPRETKFPNGNAKFWLGRLPDGRYAYIGNPGPDTARCPLVLSLSEDGKTFTRHFLLETKRTTRKFSGMYKGGLYGYPHALVFKGALYVIYSLWKEDIFVQKISLDLL